MGMCVRSWGLVVGGWWLLVGGWWLVVGGCGLVVGGLVTVATRNAPASSASLTTMPMPEKGGGGVDACVTCGVRRVACDV